MLKVKDMEEILILTHLLHDPAVLSIRAEDVPF